MLSFLPPRTQTFPFRVRWITLNRRFHFIRKLFHYDLKFSPAPHHEWAGEEHEGCFCFLCFSIFHALHFRFFFFARRWISSLLGCFAHILMKHHYLLMKNVEKEKKKKQRQEKNEWAEAKVGAHNKQTLPSGAKSEESFLPKAKKSC